MHRTALVTLNMRELDRLKVIQAVVDLGLKPGQAADQLPAGKAQRALALIRALCGYGVDRRSPSSR
ncbi:hypothetical protein [Burkholderia sp. BCC0397]|uniref:hypothetical protein n=1 Tax=Burkholderia sp. BCC0397 TaxID=486876 RepID=UPI001ABB8D31|nr:hypothetical protein [Burkholderia sp. BCC0397]